jgi:hypothetical protein
MPAVFLRHAAPLRYAARRKGTGGTACTVGFARTIGARFTHGYNPIAACSYQSEKKYAIPFDIHKNNSIILVAYIYYFIFDS